MKRYWTTALGAVLTAGVLAASAFAAAPSNTAPPQVSGTPQVGKTLTVSNGTWSNSPTGYAYQWQRCTSATSCTNIAGATTQTYVVRNADAGRTLRAVVTATNADGSSTANSNQTSTVAAGPGPQHTQRPVVLGDAFVGELLTAGNGQWNPTPDDFTYQWLQCNTAGTGCLRIPGATTSRYRVRLDDLYTRLRVDVTAHSSGGATTVRSEPSDVVQLFVPQPVAGNKTPVLTFISLKKLGSRLYARFRVCDDSGRISVVERDTKVGVLGYGRKYAVNTTSCVVATRSWTPAPRFRTVGAIRVTLQAVDKSGKRSRVLSRSIRWR